jgi:predicted Zn-dependent peptidase
MISIKKASSVIRFTLLCLLVALPLSSINVQAQVIPEPQREQLLNGLRVLISPRTGEQDVLVKLRIHSGAAFDLAGKSGEMVVLGDLLFPDPATREYFTEQMQGKLNVITDYDAMTVTMQGRASEFERIVDILRNALLATQLAPEIVNSVRDGRIKIVKETSISPATLADRAIAARLFGDFPYGLPHTGSVESLGRVERADLMLARDRFLNPNNATLVIIGGVQPPRVMRTLRQLLGIWRKSEQIVPATFKQPAAPDPRTLIINAPADQSVEVRLAARGLARSDKDAVVATVLAGVARQRWERLVPELSRNPMFVRHDARLLPGMFIMGATVNSSLAARTMVNAKEVFRSLIGAPVSAAELDQARNEAMIVFTKGLAKPDGLAEAWLDLDTYKLQPIAEQLQSLQKISAADLQRTASRLFGKAAIASVAIGNGELLKAQLEKDTPVELLGEVKAEPKVTSPPQVAKPASQQP